MYCNFETTGIFTGIYLYIFFSFCEIKICPVRDSPRKNYPVRAILAKLSCYRDVLDRLDCISIMFLKAVNYNGSYWTFKNMAVCEARSAVVFKYINKVLGSVERARRFSFEIVGEAPSEFSGGLAAGRVRRCGDTFETTRIVERHHRIWSAFWTHRLKIHKFAQFWTLNCTDSKKNDIVREID